MRHGLLPFVMIAGLMLVAAKPVVGNGFLCVGPDKEVRRINIDMKKKRFQEAGEAPQKIYEVNEAAVTLILYTTFRDGFFKSEKIDRSTLVLESSFMGGGYLVTKEYQCQIASPFNFASERQF